MQSSRPGTHIYMYANITYANIAKDSENGEFNVDGRERIVR